MNKIILKGMVVVCGAVLLCACASTKVARVAVDKKVDLTGGWNDYDATTTAKYMIADCLAKPWLTDFMKNNGRDPAVIVGHVNNRTTEHINADVITSSLERELLNSGKVVFVASPQEREQMRAERGDQQEKGFTDPETTARMGRERGADYMLIGSMNSVKDELKGQSVVLYQVNIELIDLATNTKVWMGQKDIKKVIKKSKLGF